MVSGPDLGAGFLFQLTVERRGPTDRFVYHAQEGGADAGGPPRGSPEPFGWARSSTMCPVGGRTCWHRELETPVTELPRVRTAYNRTRFTMETAIAQSHDRRPVPLDPALLELIGQSTRNPAGPGTAWAVAGATALWLRGGAVRPLSIEVETSEEGVRIWAGRFEPYLIEPPSRTPWYGGTVRLGARAFVGTMKEGARVEWVADLPGEAAPRATEGERSTELVWGGQSVQVLRPEQVLLRVAEEERRELVDCALGLVAWGEGMSDRLERLLAASTLKDRQRDELKARIGSLAREGLD